MLTQAGGLQQPFGRIQLSSTSTIVVDDALQQLPDVTTDDFDVASRGLLPEQHYLSARV